MDEENIFTNYVKDLWTKSNKILLENINQYLIYIKRYIVLVDKSDDIKYINGNLFMVEKTLSDINKIVSDIKNNNIVKEK